MIYTPAPPHGRRQIQVPNRPITGRAVNALCTTIWTQRFADRVVYGTGWRDPVSTCGTVVCVHLIYTACSGPSPHYQDMDCYGGIKHDDSDDDLDL